MKIILASASPRRKELLCQIGWEFEVQVSQTEEDLEGLPPGALTEALAKEKARAVYRLSQEEDVLIIGADTVVAMGETILGKPTDREDAVRMLEMLSGKEHSVYTGVHMIFRREDTLREISFHEVTKVRFYPMSQEEIEAYVSQEEPYDKAGAYGIQGLGAKYIEKIDGDYNNVVGLPIARLYHVAKEFGKI
jgi:septum formation protein